MVKRPKGLLLKPKSWRQVNRWLFDSNLDASKPLRRVFGKVESPEVTTVMMRDIERMLILGGS